MSSISRENYLLGPHVLNFVIYTSTTAPGEDDVPQHKYHGAEMSHITLHPDGSVNFRVERDRNWMVQFLTADLSGFSPVPSARLRNFIQTVKYRI